MDTRSVGSVKASCILSSMCKSGSNTVGAVQLRESTAVLFRIYNTLTMNFVQSGNNILTVRSQARCTRRWLDTAVHTHPNHDIAYACHKLDITAN